MRNFSLLFILITLISTSSIAQSYSEEMKAHRQEYIDHFIEDEHSPLSKKQTKYLDFFDIDSTYFVTAQFLPSPDAIPFDMATSSGVMKKYVQYGTLYFSIRDTIHSLQVYQSITLREREEYKDHLFIPFNDNTNNEETYGGGRYIDISTSDIIYGVVLLDFNKAYNPYCAYSGGYSCPVPPAENKINTEIRAGEKQYKKKGK